MNCRAVITLVGGAVASCAFWPLASAHAQRTDRPRRVGVIMGFAEDDEVWQAYLATFRQGLQQLGWTDGRNIRFDYRFTGESAERMRTMAEEVVALAPDVILVSTNSVVSATLKATRTIPIVFTWVSDPVGSGFVTNLPHPGANITGFHNFEPAIAGKWLICCDRSRLRCGGSRSCMFRTSCRMSRSCAWWKRLRRHWGSRSRQPRSAMPLTSSVCCRRSDRTAAA